MKFCPEHTQLSLNSAVEELLLRVVGDEAVGFFERKLVTSNQEMRVFIPVYQNTKPKGLVN